jgi:hypothetical protein
MRSHKIVIRKTRIQRICDLCHDPINKGEEYSKTPKGTLYCMKCKQGYFYHPITNQSFTCAWCHQVHNIQQEAAHTQSGHHPDCQCNQCHYGEDVARWMFNPSEY